MAQHRITIDHKEYTMPKVSADDYMDYLDASETINGSTNAGYKREHIQLMCEWIVRLYDNQFTIEELKYRIISGGVLNDGGHDLEQGLTESGGAALGNVPVLRFKRTGLARWRVHTGKGH